MAWVGEIVARQNLIPLAKLLYTLARISATSSKYTTSVEKRFS